MTLPLDIYSVASVRDIDRCAIEVHGIAGYALMTRAGAAAVEFAVQRFPGAKRWQIVCGGGNNGGDGYVVARLAAERGIAVSALALKSPDELSGDAATAYGDFAAQGGAVAVFDGSLDPDATLLVDGLLGSGLERDLGGRFAEVVSAMNGHSAPTLSLDLPSGLHGDSGRMLGIAVQAAATITFVALKPGLFLGDGPALVGDLGFDNLDVPDDCRTRQRPEMSRLDLEAVARYLPPRPRHAHKGKFGHVLVVGGAAGMAGAVRLCGEAALRAGAGLCSIATHPDHAAQIVARRPELMCRGVANREALEPLLERATVVALGPGLGTDAWAQSLFETVLASSRPLIVDADALNLLAAAGHRRDDWILTPHPGEAGRLLGSDAGAVQADRRAAARSLQDRFGGVVVLKGAGTLIQAEGAVPWVCTGGNPGMASAGMGDVLTGIIAGLAAQGLAPELAARLGVSVHAAAGDRAALAGERGLLALDLVAEIRQCVNP